MNTAVVKKWLGYLNDPKTNKKSVLVGILDECTYEELELIYNKSHSIFKGLLSLSYLKRSSYAQIYNNSIQPRRSIKDYIGLLVYVVKKNASLINQYIPMRQAVDSAVLVGDYTKARKLIDTINKELSYSYWAATYLIKIERLDKGLNACSNLYNELYMENKTIVQYFYYCAFRSSSLDFLLDDVKRVLWPEKTPDAEFVNNFLISHCMPYLGFSEGEWMCTDMNSSIIDLYNNLINFLPNLSEDTLNDNSVRSSLRELNTSINDKYVKKLCYLYKIDDIPVIEADRTAIIDLFITRNYAATLEKSEQYLQQHIDDFEIQSINLKSLSHLDGQIIEPATNGTLIEKIRYHYLEILTHKTSQSFHKRKLLNICRSQYHIQGVRYMYALIDGLESNDISMLYATTWKHLPYNSPFDSNLFAKKEDGLAYIHTLSGAKDFWNQVFEENPTTLSSECYELSVASNTGDVLFAVLLEKYNSAAIPSYLKDLVASFIFNYYIDKQKYKEGICFYVESKLKDDALTIGLKDKNIIIAMLDNKELSRESPLELSVFAEMVGADAETLYFIYKKYLKQCGVNRASEIIVNGDGKQYYFLERVAVIKVLTLHVLRFKSVLQVMEERSAICSNLYDYSQSKKINDEISAICRDIKIMELNNQVDESKIYVDIKSIKERELVKAKELYDMFESATNQVAYRDIVIGEFISRLNSSGLPAAFAELDENGQLKDFSGKIEMVNYRKDVLTQIFLAIREQFLFNPKYGLDNYLSTRIRHGTLVNQLRNQFEECNLVTNTVNNIYSHNEYWVSNQFRLEGSKSLQSFQLFETFSRDIDNIIIEIKDSYIQVKTEKNKEKERGCFDFDKCYFEDDIDRLLVDKSMNSFDVCFDLVLECLWQRTEQCLETMRDKLLIAQTDMLSLLHTLQRDMVTLVGAGSNGVISFNDTIGYCQNGIQKDLQIVTKWFKRSSYVDFDFTIGQVIETSIGFIRRNNKNMLKTCVDDSSITTLQGRYFGTLYDIFHDMLNNALDYEKESHIGGECNIKVAEEDGFLHIQVSNPIRENDIELLTQKVNKINSELEVMLRTGKSRDEGNSGCSKIFNAVNYHLGSSHNTYINVISERCFIVKIEIDVTPIRR